MNLEKRLAQLRHIEPDEAYTARSRMRILGGSFFPAFQSRKVLSRIFEAGTAITLAGVLVFLVLGGFSGWGGPGSVSGLDPAALRVEAQAIDAQIELLGLDYAGILGAAESGIVEVERETVIASEEKEEEEEDHATSTEVTLDDVLRQLSE